MDCLTIIGFASLGTFVGILVGWVTNEKGSAKGYSALIAAVVGAAASFAPLFSPTVGKEVWVYPIFLLFGLFIAPLVDFAFSWFYGLKRVKAAHQRAKY